MLSDGHWNVVLTMPWCGQVFCLPEPEQYASQRVFKFCGPGSAQALGCMMGQTVGRTMIVQADCADVAKALRPLGAKILEGEGEDRPGATTMI